MKITAQEKIDNKHQRLKNNGVRSNNKFKIRGKRRRRRKASRNQVKYIYMMELKFVQQPTEFHNLKFHFF